MDPQGHGTPPHPMVTGVQHPPGTSFAAYQHHHHHHHQQHNQQLQLFWADQYREIVQTTDFKNRNLPLARIRKIMKADEDVRVTAAEASVVITRACETFILELTQRMWAHAEENKRRTLQKNDIAAAIIRTAVFDFLVDIVPREEGKEDDGVARAALGAPPGAHPMAYHYMPH